MSHIKILKSGKIAKKGLGYNSYNEKEEILKRKQKLIDKIMENYSFEKKK